MRILVVSEGGRDIGDARDERRGAVQVLVRRVLSAKLEREVRAEELDGVPLPRVHEQSSQASGYGRKVHLAIAEGTARDCTSVALVVDRDRAPGHSRLQALTQGVQRAIAAGHALANATAVGVAVETVEAWLLADERALNLALSPVPAAQREPNPENLTGKPGTSNHPKVRFEAVVERATRNKDVAYDEVAEHADLATVESRCPTGFARFADEVRGRCR